MTQRISSTRCEVDSQGIPLKVDALEELLCKELSDAIHFGSKKLVESVFPDSMLPFPITKRLLRSVGHKMHSLSRPLTEEGVAKWMNGIGAALAMHKNQCSTRVWDASRCNKPLSGSPHDRKLDVMLLDQGLQREPTWPVVRALCEVTNQRAFHKTIKDTLYQKACIMFTKQLDRRFVPTLSFFGTSFRFVTCDRSGVVHSITYDIENDRLILLRIIAGLLFGDDSVIGYDKTMRHGDNGEIIAIMVAGEEYSVVEKIFSSETLRGRATQCWRVRKDVKDYVLKDSWIHNGRTASEIETLKLIFDVEGVPKLIAGEEVKLPNGKVDSTNLRRHGITHDEERLHRRLVMEPVAEPLSSFKSKKELIGAIKDIVQGIWGLICIVHATHDI
jgi:hypothetical protein